MPFKIIRNDITKVHADAIVNTANPEPVFDRGTDQAIYQAAGKRKLLRERKKIGRIAAGSGEHRLTHAKYIIHNRTGLGTGITGRRSFWPAIAVTLIARQHEKHRIPLISTGVYGFPNKSWTLPSGSFFLLRPKTLRWRFDSGSDSGSDSGLDSS